MKIPTVLYGITPFLGVFLVIFLSGKFTSIKNIISNFISNRKKDKEINKLKQDQLNDVLKKENEIKLKIKMSENVSESKKKQINEAIGRLNKTLKIIDNDKPEENISLFTETW